MCYFTAPDLYFSWEICCILVLFTFMYMSHARLLIINSFHWIYYFIQWCVLILFKACLISWNYGLIRKKERNRLSWLHLEKEGTPSYIPSKLLTMCLAGMENTYLWLNRPPGLIDIRFHTKISLHQEEYNKPLFVNHLCNLYGTHWCRLPYITSWPFWLWIMAVTWLYFPLTFSRLS